MVYQRKANLLDKGVALNASNQPSKFKTKNWFEISTWSVNRQINFKASVLRSSLCD